MRAISAALALVAVCAPLAGARPAMAQGRCVVTDPTGTPLNVRAEPNGSIVGALFNGVAVRQLDTVVDERGRAWSLVAPADGGKTGWVFRAFVRCD